MSLNKGDRLGRFEIVGLLGSGAMGEVYRAFDPELERQVALKVLPDELADQPERLSRFEREARSVGRLRHPNLLAIHDLGRREGTPYLVFELLEGVTLEEKLEAGPLPVEEALSLAVQIAEGLAAAHAAGVVHRDLKPANLFVCEDGCVKILDFGLARAAVSEEEDLSRFQTRTALSREGVLLGTVAYMAPEQAAGQTVDARADQFSLGVVLYEMLTGSRPFVGETTPELLTAILRDRPEPLEKVAPQVPAPLRWLVERSLERDPSARWESTDDLARELALLGRRLPELADRGDARSGEPESSRDVRKRFQSLRRRLAGLSFLLLAALAAIAVLLVRRPAPPAAPRFQQITFQRGTVTAARFDPTSDSVLYSATWEGKPARLFLHRPPAVDPIEIGPPNSRLTAVSSTGELLLVRDVHGVGPFLRIGNLARMPLTGAPRLLTEDVSEAAFGPDGELAAVVREREGRSILEFPPGRERLTTGGIVLHPRLSPDGRRLALALAPQRGHEWGPMVVLERDGGERTLSEEAGYGLAWGPDSREIWYVTKQNQNQLGAVTLDGRRRIVAGFPTMIHLFDVAPDGRVLLSAQDRRFEMVGRPPGGAERDLSWLSWSVPFDLTADGRTILFNECTGFQFECRTALRSFEEEAPVVIERGGFGVRFTPDGEWVLSVPPWSPDRVVMIATRSEERRRLDVEGLERISIVAWDPAGEGIYLSGQAPGEGVRIYRLALSGGAPTPLTGDDIHFGFFAVSTDGRSIAAQRLDGTTAIYPASGGEPRVIDHSGQPIRWSPDGRFLYTMRLGEAPGALRRLDLVEGGVETLATLMPQDPAGVVQVSPVAVSADGEGWVYGYLRQLDQLFVVDGLE